MKLREALRKFSSNQTKMLFWNQLIRKWWSKVKGQRSRLFRTYSYYFDSFILVSSYFYTEMTFSCLQHPSMPLPGRVRSSPGRWPLSTRCTAWGGPNCPPALSAPHSAVPSWRRWSWRPWSASQRSQTLQTGSARECACLTGRRQLPSSLGRDTICRSTMWCWWRGGGRRTFLESNSKWSEANMTVHMWWRRNSRATEGHWRDADVCEMLNKNMFCQSCHRVISVMWYENYFILMIINSN